MAKRHGSQGDWKVLLTIAGAAFSIGLLLSSFIFSPAYAQDALMDLKVTLPPSAPAQPAQAVDAPSVPVQPALSVQPSAVVPQPSVDDTLIALLNADFTPPSKPQASAPQNQWRTVRMKVTGYCACAKCCGTEDGITACNHRIRRGDAFVAADRAYPFGTQMIIPGYSASRPVKVLDRGGAIKGDHLDLFFHSHAQALNWGVKYLDVQIKQP